MRHLDNTDKSELHKLQLLKDEQGFFPLYLIFIVIIIIIVIVVIISVLYLIFIVRSVACGSLQGRNYKTLIEGAEN